MLESKKFSLLLILFITTLGATAPTSAAVNSTELRQKLFKATSENSKGGSDAVVFDLPVTYNKKVKSWITYYQTSGRKWFKSWLERSTKYMPFIQQELKNAGIPQDLAFMVMIESGFSFQATSTASAVGPWQFIQDTGNRYGLQNRWWLDERRDLKKSTTAAIRYLKDLYAEFGSWYLVAASYNMGENGLRKKIKRYRTNDFWALIHLNALPDETKEYVPKILAAMMITKAPGLYGFRDIISHDPFEYDTVLVPGGTDLAQVAEALGVTTQLILEMNAELILGYVPRQVGHHIIRVPRGAARLVQNYLAKNEEWKLNN